MATIKNVPAKIYELIKNKRYGRFSAEVYFDAFIKEKPFRRALKAVALLGADTPAVSSMNDLVNLYKRDETIKYSQIVNTDKGDDMSKNFSDDLETLKNENKRLREGLEQTNKDRQKDKVNAYINKAVEKGLILPAQTGLYSALMMDTQVKSFSMIEGDKLQEKQFSAFDIVTQILEGSKPQVDFSERSQNHKPEKLSESDLLDGKIKEYMTAHKTDYSSAFDAVIREVK